MNAREVPHQRIRTGLRHPDGTAIDIYCISKPSGRKALTDFGDTLGLISLLTPGAGLSEGSLKELKKRCGRTGAKLEGCALTKELGSGISIEEEACSLAELAQWAVRQAYPRNRLEENGKTATRGKNQTRP